MYRLLFSSVLALSVSHSVLAVMTDDGADGYGNESPTHSSRKRPRAKSLPLSGEGNQSNVFFTVLDSYQKRGANSTAELPEVTPDSVSGHRDKHVKMTLQVSGSTSETDTDTEQLQEVQPTKSRPSTRRRFDWEKELPKLEETCRLIIEELDDSSPFPTPKAMIEKLAARNIHKPAGRSESAYIQKLNRTLKPLREAYTGPAARTDWNKELPKLEETCRLIIEELDGSSPFPTPRAMIEKLAARNIHKPREATDEAYEGKVWSIIKPLREAYTGSVVYPINWKVELPDLKEDCTNIIEELDDSSPFPTSREMIEKLAARGIHKPTKATDEAYEGKVRKIIRPLREAYTGSVVHPFKWKVELPGLQDACRQIIEAHDSYRFPSANRVIEKLVARGIRKPTEVTDEQYEEKVRNIIRPLRRQHKEAWMNRFSFSLQTEAPGSSARINRNVGFAGLEGLDDSSTCPTGEEMIDRDVDGNAYPTPFSRRGDRAEFLPILEEGNQSSSRRKVVESERHDNSPQTLSGVHTDYIALINSALKGSPSPARGQNVEISTWRRVLAIPSLIGGPRAQVEFRLGYAYEEKGQWDEAIETYKRALDIPDCQGKLRAATECNLGNAYGTKGQWDEAIKAKKRALDIPDWQGKLRASTESKLGYVYGKKGQWDEAIKAYKRALDIPSFIGEDRSNAERELGRAFYEAQKKT